MRRDDVAMCQMPESTSDRPAAAQDDVAVPVKPPESLHRAVIELVLAIGGLAVMSDPHRIARRECQFLRVEHLKPCRLRNRQLTSAVDREAIATVESLGVLVELQYVARLVIYGVAPFRFREVG